VSGACRGARWAGVTKVDGDQIEVTIIGVGVVRYACAEFSRVVSVRSFGAGAAPTHGSHSHRQPDNVPAFSCERQRAAEGRPTSSSAATPCWAAVVRLATARNRELTKDVGQSSLVEAACGNGDHGVV
jgi:hypothetical protein